MMNMRFPTAFQIVLCVALKDEQGLKSTSAELAEGLESNPSFVRKMLIPLTHCGILKSSQGRHGGVMLGRSAEAITLRDIYCAVLDQQKIWTARPRDEATGLRNLEYASLFRAVETEAEEALVAVLDKRTVADSMRQLKETQPDMGLSSQPRGFSGVLPLWTKQDSLAN